MEQELSCLGKQRWTWRFKPPALELICPVKRYLDRDAYPNPEQFRHFYPRFEQLVDRHDRLVEKLTEAAHRLHEKVRNDPVLQSEIEEAVSPSGLNALGVSSVSEICGAYPASEHLDLVAQYVVNHLGDQPPHYSTAKLWNVRRNKLIKVLARPGIRELNPEARGTANQLASLSTELVEHLKEVRLTLSLKHDVPPSSVGLITSGVHTQ